MTATTTDQKRLSGPELRRLFVDFFQEWGAYEMPSSSLVPKNDPTVLLTVAGMQQMTPFFMGVETPPERRLTSVQKCFRTVDIDEVGDESHLTFFEMLGNFSVGDYFKEDAIRFAWQLLTEVYGLPPDRLWVTVYPTDEEARAIWRDQIGLPEERITVTATPEKDNWWGPVGPAGPCGPCSEIYYDFGPGEGRTGERPGDDGGRFLEVWNLVFMEFYRDENGVDTPLPRKNIDTGMGLERLAMVVQGKRSVYETDLYQPIIARAAALTGTHYGENPQTDRALRVLADHSRSIVFLIADGVLPANEGRGYILRRVLRRAVRYGRLLGLERPFLAETARVVIDLMSDQYPELRDRAEYIFRVIRHEEETFSRTLAVGLQRFETLVSGVKARGETTIPGAEVFRLYDTYGFPFDLTAELAREEGLEIAQAEFDQAMARQQQISRGASRFGQESHRDLEAYAGLSLPATDFLGYTQTRASGEVLAILGPDGPQQEARASEEVEVILDRTPFYAEAGGQVGDTGTLAGGDGRFRVRDTQRPVSGLTAHRGVVEEGVIRVGDTVEAAIDEARRRDIERNHTATHVLHRALRVVLGPHAQQAGSLVAPDRLRFDFTHLQALTPEELAQVGEIANAATLANERVYDEWMDQQAALATGAMALFGEKYGDRVRVVTIEDFSKELCGGTHVPATGAIGPIVITQETSVASGVRRIEALSGRGALAHLNQLREVAGALSSGLRAPVAELPAQVEGLRGRIRELERELDRARAQLAGGQVDALLRQAREVEGVRVLAARVEAPNQDTLSRLGDSLRDKLGSGVLLLGAVINERPALLAVVTSDLVARGLKAGALLGAAAGVLGGRGGGRPDRAQGGGGDPARLDAALGAVPDEVRRVLSAES